MRAHYLQHVPFEGLGSIEEWLRVVRADVKATRFWESRVLPDPDGIDLLVIMGGPMSVNDESELPWLVEEKQFIRQVIQAGRPVLGICLGAQLIASAMGACVYPNTEKEIGWFPVTVNPLPDPSVFRFPSAMNVFHWHGETFDLPLGAVRLARSDGCDNQAFQCGRSVIGLQFHLEITPENVRQLLDHCRADLAPSRYVQTEAAILQTNPDGTTLRTAPWRMY